jgi:hypothetical protein
MIDSDVILVMDQSTGFGDNYGNIYSTYVGMNEITKLDLSVFVFFNADRNGYFGNYKPNLDFYEKLFDFSKFEKNLSFYETIPENFIFYKNIDTTYQIFINKNNKNLILEKLNSVNFYGYTHHLIRVNGKKLNKEYFGLNFLNKDIVKKSEFIQNNEGKFIGVHIRIDDLNHLNGNIGNKIQNQIDDILIKFPEHKILLSGLGDVIKYFKINENKLIKIEKYVEEDVPFFYKDVLEMSLYSYSDLTFKYCFWDSAFLTYSILKNLKNKNLDDIIRII